MQPLLRRYGLLAVVAFGVVLVIVGFAVHSTPLGFIGVIFVLFAGALQRAVWSKQSIERAQTGTNRVVTVWRGSDALTIKRYEEAGWTLTASEPIKGLGGQIGSKLSFRKV